MIGTAALTKDSSTTISVENTGRSGWLGTTGVGDAMLRQLEGCKEVAGTKNAPFKWRGEKGELGPAIYG